MKQHHHVSLEATNQYHKALVRSTETSDPKRDDLIVAIIKDLVLDVDQGEPLDMKIATPHEIAKNVELCNPMVRPYGCGPVAPAEWIVLRTYQKIIELRDEIRFDTLGIAQGDQTFKRRYQQAMRDIRRSQQYTSGKKVTPAKGERARKGSSLAEGEMQAFWFKNDYIRTETEAVEHAFRDLKNKYWHRYMFPFACFFFEKQSMGPLIPWVEAGHMLTGNTTSGSGAGGLCINPYSVTATDVLYLCNTAGYLERFVYIIGILLWAKRRGCNLLKHEKSRYMDRKSAPRDQAAIDYFTMEKHFQVFGSIYMHRRVLELNKVDVGGNWNEMLEILDQLESEMMSEWGLDKNALRKDFEHMIIKSTRHTLTSLKTVFPAVSKVGDSKK